ncbi:helix-turn-helix domain-containing protein [Natronobacterium texcoconense]|uniref:GAF and HTH_10 associated domain-containing protein n=1 Tax=Natronobacterium texcoconense TaxID=1095778 RepID=A0A1H1G7G1_NATTX|nr:helix-turn-helix domain-containing protein [Natronobacterium texcoconense]SDR08989.1 hypothetical protein SAMN04489842_2293 [Natronobacterium texcoconense]
MLVARYVVSSTILQSTLAEFSDVLLRHAAQYLTDEGTIRLLFWASGVSQERFEDALEDDSTAAEFRRLDETDDRSFYRVDLTEEGHRQSTFPMWSADGVVLLDAQGTNDGWRVRMQFPDRSTLVEYRRRYVDNGGTFTLLSLYRSEDRDNGLEATLSSTQHEALLTAYDSGYFEVPRRITQTELGNRLGISSQSVSERLRRAVSALIESMFPRDRT